MLFGRALLMTVTILSSFLFIGCSRSETPNHMAEFGVPDAVGGELAAATDQVCRDGIGEWDMFGMTLAAVPDYLDQPVIVSQRGEWVTAMYVNSAGGAGYCLAWLQDDANPTAATWAIWGDGWPQTGAGMNVELGPISSGGRNSLDSADYLTPLSPDGIVVTSWHRPRIQQDLTPELRELFGMPPVDLVPDPPMGIFGRVGADISGLTFHTFYDGDVAAEISDGWFAALWPGSFGGRICGTTTSADGTITEQIACDPFVSATLTLDDGTTIEYELAELEN